MRLFFLFLTWAFLVSCRQYISKQEKDEIQFTSNEEIRMRVKAVIVDTLIIAPREAIFYTEFLGFLIEVQNCSHENVVLFHRYFYPPEGDSLGQVYYYVRDRYSRHLKKEKLLTLSRQDENGMCTVVKRDSITTFMASVSLEQFNAAQETNLMFTNDSISNFIRRPYIAKSLSEFFSQVKLYYSVNTRVSVDPQLCSTNSTIVNFPIPLKNQPDTIIYRDDVLNGLWIQF